MCIRDSLLSDAMGVEPPHVEPHNVSAWAQYTVRVQDRASVQQALMDVGIPTAIHYPMPLNQQPAVASSASTLPHGDLAAKQVLSLPMHPYLAESDTSEICRIIR